MPDHDDTDDVPANGPPPSPDDRLWRHPSELGSARPVTIITAPRNPRRTLAVGVAGGFLGAAAMLGLVFALGGFDRHRPVTAVEQIQLSQPKDPAPSELAIADKALPAVVQVSTTTAGGIVTGTAVVFRDDGHLLTTADVVEGAEALSVELADGTVVPAQVVGIDRASDIAVLKVEHGTMPVAALAMEADLQLGEPTIAVECLAGKPGSPNLSVGLVSALGRRVDATDGSSLHDMIQTNVHLSTTGSGAVLLDSRGAAIGLVTRRGMPDTSGPTSKVTATTTGRSSVLVPRYATPMEYAKVVADQLIATGRAAHPWLGVESSDLTENDMDSLGHGGARIERITPGSPAEGAGLAAGDIVVGVDESPIDSSSDLVVALRRHKPSESVGITYLRAGEAGVALATLADKPSLP
ncbi:MAG TPA: trypsin-like peptidase domain-containing protein [Acidimicrobiales bacterium]